MYLHEIRVYTARPEKKTNSVYQFWVANKLSITCHDDDAIDLTQQQNRIDERKAILLI